MLFRNARQKALKSGQHFSLERVWWNNREKPSVWREEHERLSHKLLGRRGPERVTPQLCDLRLHHNPGGAQPFTCKAPDGCKVQLQPEKTGACLRGIWVSLPHTLMRSNWITASLILPKDNRDLGKIKKNPQRESPSWPGAKWIHSRTNRWVHHFSLLRACFWFNYLWLFFWTEMKPCGSRWPHL